jgi:predicted porin
MKKTLIALAAVAATGAAFAQSSVTLYGVADIAVGKVNNAGLGLANDDFQAIASSVLNNGTSRFGFRGTEDLGGGLKAGFNFEGGLSLANGAGNLSGGQMFSRAANISLMGGFGEIRAGRSLTPSFYSVAAWELTGTANYSVVANQFSFAGAGPRDSGLIMYRSPNFGGFTVDLGTVLSGNNVYTAGTPAVGKGKVDAAVTYSSGLIVASLAYNKVSASDTYVTIGGKYMFQSFAVAGSYNIQGASNVVGNTTGSDKKGFTVGVSAPVGPVTLTADVARATTTGMKNTDLLLEAKYALSKRTTAYGVYMKDGQTGGAKSVNGVAVGVRHNF